MFNLREVPVSMMHGPFRGLGVLLLPLAMLLPEIGCSIEPKINFYTADRASVGGTLSLPAAVTDQYYEVRITPDLDPSFVASDSKPFSGDRATYFIRSAPAGRYFLWGFVDVDHSGSPNTGDYLGWYGQRDAASRPRMQNVIIPDDADASVTFDFSLFLVP